MEEYKEAFKAQSIGGLKTGTAFEEWVLCGFFACPCFFLWYVFANLLLRSHYGLYSGITMKKSKIRYSILALATAFMLFQLLIGNAYAISNGVPDGNDHPYVCWIVTYDGASDYVFLGSGSLIAQNVVLTAGHVTNDAGGQPIAYAWVSFSPTASWPPWAGGGDWIAVVGLGTHPLYNMGGAKGITDWLTYDVGILILSEDVSLAEYAELPSLGQVNTLPMKQNLELVGYGVQYQVRGAGIPPSGNWNWIDFGWRYQTQSELIASNNVMSEQFIRVTANPAQGKGGTCFGDSGSPILLAGTNTIVGVCSWGTNGNCAGVSYDQRIDIPEILPWILAMVEVFSGA